MSQELKAVLSDSYIRILGEIKDLRLEFREELIRITSNLDLKITQLIQSQQDYIELYNKQLIEMKKIEHDTELKLQKIEMRVHELERFRYILFFAVLIGCVLGPSIIGYLPSLLKFL